MPPRMHYDMTEITNVAEGRLCHLGECRSAFALNKEVFLREMVAEPSQAKWKRETTSQANVDMIMLQ